MSRMTYDSDNDSIGWYPANWPYSFREQGPCEIHIVGQVFFSQITAKTHNRIQGPSRIYPNGHIMYTNPRGLYHRTDGPATIKADCRKEYWVNGREIPADEFFLKYGVL